MSAVISNEATNEFVEIRPTPQHHNKQKTKLLWKLAFCVSVVTYESWYQIITLSQDFT